MSLQTFQKKILDLDFQKNMIFSYQYFVSNQK